MAEGEAKEDKLSSIRGLLTRPSPFALSAFQPSEEVLEFVQNEVRVLVVGAGGLGCELLKDLALSGFTDIEVIDMDSIDISNLNRQFLFRKKDTGRPKSVVAAEFIQKRCKGVKVKAHNCNIMEKDKKWYKRFNIVIAGLDSIEARGWLNRMLIDCIEYDEDGDIKWDTVIPMIDGGTTGFRGQARVIFPPHTACYECTLKSLPPEEGFHLCTIASKPRKPEHCVAYAVQILWPLLEEFKGVKDYKMRSRLKPIVEGEDPELEEAKIPFDNDDPAHMTWIWQRSVERAKEFNITEPSYNQTMQVVKNIIPAIASTNAVIAAACVNEAFKIIAMSHPRMNSYFQYNGHSGCQTETFPYKRDPECDVCAPPAHLKFGKDVTLGTFLEKLTKDLFTEDKEAPPALTFAGKILYMKAKKRVAGMDFEEDLPKTLVSLGLKDKSVVIAVQERRQRRVIVHFTGAA
jgi:ubiquitin-activating enzyme E1 C